MSERLARQIDRDALPFAGTQGDIPERFELTNRARKARLRPVDVHLHDFRGCARARVLDPKLHAYRVRALMNGGAVVLEAHVAQTMTERIPRLDRRTIEVAVPH